MSKQKKKINKFSTIADFLFESGTLRKTVRAHRQTLLADDLSDNIASHSFRVTLIGWFLAKEEKADPYKVLLMCLTHDLAEARSGDQNWVHKKYVKVFEEEITKDQFASLPHAEELKQLTSEYQKRQSKESQLAKDADLIDQVLLLKEYAWRGNKEAADWLQGRAQEKLVTSNSAKKILKAIRDTTPSNWWRDIWTSERR